MSRVRGERVEQVQQPSAPGFGDQDSLGQPNPLAQGTVFLVAATSRAAW